MRPMPQILRKYCWHPELRHDTRAAILEPKHHAKFGLTKPCRIGKHGLEHGLKLAGRAGDHAQHLRRCGLLLEQFRKLARARLLRLEQTHVLDGDHGLVGKRRHQLDLLVGKRPHVRALQHDHADGRPFTQHRDSQHCVKTSEPRRLMEGVFPIGLDVRNVNSSTFKDSAAYERSSTHFKRVSFHELVQRDWMTEIGDLPVGVSFLAIDRAHVGFAQADS